MHHIKKIIITFLSIFFIHYIYIYLKDEFWINELFDVMKMAQVESCTISTILNDEYAEDTLQTLEMFLEDFNRYYQKNQNQKVTFNLILSKEPDNSIKKKLIKWFDRYDIWFSIINYAEIEEILKKNYDINIELLSQPVIEDLLKFSSLIQKDDHALFINLDWLPKASKQIKKRKFWEDLLLNKRSLISLGNCSVDELGVFDVDNSLLSISKKSPLLSVFLKKIRNNLSHYGEYLKKYTLLAESKNFDPLIEWYLNNPNTELNEYVLECSVAGRAFLMKELLDNKNIAVLKAELPFMLHDRSVLQSSLTTSTLLRLFGKEKTSAMIKYLLETKYSNYHSDDLSILWESFDDAQKSILLDFLLSH